MYTPPNPNLNIGPGGGGQTLHSQTNMNDSMGTGLPPTSLMQSQMSNGPSHAPTQQQPSTSMSLPASSHGTGPGYSHSAPTSQGQVAYSSMASRAKLNMQSSQVSMMHQQGTGPHYSSTSAGGQHYQGQQTGIMAQGNQGNIIMSQRPLGSYCVPQQGSAPQYMGQEEFYGEQYGHSQSSSEPVSQQYYSDDLAFLPRFVVAGLKDWSFEASVFFCVMGSIPISSLPMGSRIMRDPLTSRHNTITKAETLSTANSRHSTNKALGRTRRSANSSTHPKPDTALSLRDTVQGRTAHPSILSISRARASSTHHTAPYSQDQPLRHRDPTLLNRVSMETISNKETWLMFGAVFCVHPSLRWAVEKQRILHQPYLTGLLWNQNQTL